jgi:methionyl-tRNA formyltransferase
MRVVFMGTPAFAVPSLRALVEHGWAFAGVYTQPDRPAGRGRQVASSPVKRAALELGLPVFQPASLRPADEVERLAELRPDVIVVAAFGQILRSNVISIPPNGIVNVHASLLPRWRGAAPITAAILAGDAETGVTIMQIDPGMDTGPMLAKRAIPIDVTDTTGALTDKLAVLGAELLAEALPRWVAGEIAPEPQDDSLATLAPRVKPEDAIVDWAQPADFIARQVRAYQPWPGAHSWLRGKKLTILAAEPIDLQEPANAPIASRVGAGQPGDLFPLKNGVVVVTGKGALRLHRVQLEGGKPLDIAAFRAGQRELSGASLANP